MKIRTILLISALTAHILTLSISEDEKINLFHLMKLTTDGVLIKTICD